VNIKTTQWKEIGKRKKKKGGGRRDKGELLFVNLTTLVLCNQSIQLYDWKAL
jgi:hypothetical protein